ncbi:MAG: CpsB/CapC family capsule biosynthesis tyrosine phosphatase [Pseudomonadota bacterium]
MIDIHTHLLPGIDDGADDLAMAVAMAKIAESDGIKVLACTPHVKPPRYPNVGKDIRARVEKLHNELQRARVDVSLVAGGDIHIAHDLLSSLRDGVAPCLHDSRYFLFEPNHTVLTPRLDALCSELFNAGYKPVLTHPERLVWVPKHYNLIKKLYEAGVVMQVTAGSLTGAFGTRVYQLSRRMMDDGIVDVVATDAHNVTARPPILSRARDWIAAEYGEIVAKRLTVDNPMRILRDLDILRPQSLVRNIPVGGRT